MTRGRRSRHVLDDASNETGRSKNGESTARGIMSRIKDFVGTSAWHPLWLLAAGYWLWLLWACMGDWTNVADYNYGWFVPPLALYFLWKRSEQTPVSAGGGGAPKWPAWLVIVLSVLVVFPLELVRQAPMHWRPYPWIIGFAAFGTTISVAWLIAGKNGVRKIVFPTLFALTAIPWPTFFENLLTSPLMGVVTAWSAALVRLAGYPATVAGNVITLPNCTVGVEEACSGLRSLQTALMVGLAAGELKMLGAGKRLALLGLAFVFALIGNQIRVLMLVFAGIRGGAESVASIHDLAGYSVLGVLLVGVALSSHLLGHAGQENGELSASHREDLLNEAKQVVTKEKTPAGRVAGAAVFAFALISMILAHGWYWFAAGGASKPVPAMLVPRAGAGFVVDKDVPNAVLDMMRPDEWSYIRAERNSQPAEVVGYHFYWRPGRGNARQMYHRPDACMPGAGWRIDGEVTRQTVRIGDRDIAFNVFPFRNPGGRSLIYWASYLNGQPVELEFETDRRLATEKLWEYVRNGVSQHSYEVAAFVLPDVGRTATDAQAVQVFANRVFQEAGGEGEKGLKD